MLFKIESALLQLRQTKPLVLCLTNYVTMDFMANCLLSLGAAPIMSHDIRELEELMQMSHAVTINIGTLNAKFVEHSKAVIRFAKQSGKSIIFDPVGAGASRLRTLTARDLMTSSDIIRGNSSEIIALLADTQETLGVESTHQVSDAMRSASCLATQHKCTVIVSGERDFITDGKRERVLRFGSPLMPFITGMGCALTAVIAAFRAVVPDSFEAGNIATGYYGLCGMLAARKSDRPGSFRTAFIADLYQCNFDEMRKIYAE